MKTDCQKVLQHYDKAVTHLGKFERTGKTMPYTSANGHMFSFINTDGEFGVRLPHEVARQFLEDHDSGPFRSHGATMKDYVLVPNGKLADVEFMADLLEQGYKYVMALPPK